MAKNFTAVHKRLSYSVSDKYFGKKHQNIYLKHWMSFINLSKSSIFLVICSLLTGCQKQETTLQGYVDADYTYISSNAPGNLIQLFVYRGNAVIKGQHLFIL